ncbi:MAG: type IX secretion system protein PorQ [Prevotella sp.]|nr:type IX secretion system protein PorQ [Prevotella sp.]MCM1074807.1 type IX secretion system protein PorQ [Ruminococcus sp.]
MRIAISMLMLVAVLICGKAAAQQSTYSCLEVPYSSHAFALGGYGAGIAVIDPDITLAGANPGLLGNEVETQASVNYMHYLGDSNFVGVHFGMGYGAHSAWACGIQYLGYGNVVGTLPDGTITGDFAMHDIMLNGIYAYDITDRLRGGLNIKMVVSSYEHYSALALAADVGINYYDPERDMSLSAVLKNMGGQIKRFDRDYVRVPFDIQLGWMQRIGESPFQIAASAHDLTKWKMPYYKHDTDGLGETEIKDSFADNLLRHLTFGLQYSPSEKFYIALGYNHKMRTDMSTYKRNFLSGFSAGFGLRVKDFKVDVSYAQPHRGGSSIMLNLGMNVQELLRL